MGTWKEQVVEASHRALTWLMKDERRAQRVAEAIGAVQRGKKALDRTQEALLRSVGLVPRSDFKEVGRQLAGLKRRLRELDEKLERLGRE